jgi:hypothetical protein
MFKTPDDQMLSHGAKKSKRQIAGAAKRPEYPPLGSSAY